MTTTSKTTTQEIVEAYGVFVSDCKKHIGDNFELVICALAHIEEVDTILGVLTDPSPVDVESVLKQAGYEISTGEISDHMYKIQHPEPEEIPVDPKAPLTEETANTLQAIIQAELPKGYRATIVHPDIPDSYFYVGIMDDGNKPMSRCIFTVHNQYEWDRMKQFILSMRTIIA